MMTIDQLPAVLSECVIKNNHSRINEPASVNKARIFWYRHQVFVLNCLFVFWLVCTAGALGSSILDAPNNLQCTHHLNLN